MQKQSAEAFCISRPLALCFYLPALASIVFTSPGPQFVFTGPGPQFVFTDSDPQFAFTSPGSQFFPPALAYNFITSPGPKFLYTSIIYQCCISIYGSGLGFVLPVWICIYLIIGSSSSGSSNNSSSNFVGINNTNICMSVLLNYGKRTEARAHTGC